MEFTSLGSEKGVRVSIRSLNLQAEGFDTRKKGARQAAARAMLGKLATAEGREERPADCAGSSSRDAQPASTPLDAISISETSKSMGHSHQLSLQTQNGKNFVGRLKEYLDVRGMLQPHYEDTPSESGFAMSARVSSMSQLVGTGHGRTKKEAKQEAARELLQSLQSSHCALGSSVGRNSIGGQIGDEENAVLTLADAEKPPPASSTVSNMSISTNEGVILSEVTALEENKCIEELLQDLLEQYELPFPVYKPSVKKNSSGLAKLFSTILEVEGEISTCGCGASKKEADEKAAHNMVLHLRCKYEKQRGVGASPAKSEDEIGNLVEMEEKQQENVDEVNGSSMLEAPLNIGVWQGVAIARGLPKFSPWAIMLYPSTPCRQATPEMVLRQLLGWPPTGWATCSRLLPLWIPHAVRLCL
jgi:dsRNA-specific ribonuclease